MISTDIRLAKASLRSSKIRSLLTMFAIIVGVAGYVLVTTFVDGLKGSLTTQIDELGANVVAVNSGQIVQKDENGEITNVNFGASILGEPTLTEQDYQAISKIEAIEYVSPQVIISGSGVVTIDETEFTGISLLASNEHIFSFLNQKLELGSGFAEDNLDKNFTVIGSKLAAEMFPGGSGLGKQITLLRQRFTVIGILPELEGLQGGFGGFDLNRIAILPFDAYKALKGSAVSIDEIDIKVKDDGDVDAVVAEVETLLLDNHLGESDFTVLKTDEFAELTGNIFDQLKSASQVLSYVMLFVGGVVIALIMLITVKERTREIGIRKSIGATNGNILTQFLVEAVLLSWVGSMIGVLIAYLLGLYIGAVSGITPVYTLNTVLSVIIISTIIGGVSGLIPAIGASRKDPVEALRNE